MAPATPAGTPRPAEPLATGPFPESASATLQGPSRSPGHTGATLVSVQGPRTPCPTVGAGTAPHRRAMAASGAGKRGWRHGRQHPTEIVSSPDAHLHADQLRCGGSGDPETGARRSRPAGLREGAPQRVCPWAHSPSRRASPPAAPPDHRRSDGGSRQADSLVVG